MVVIQECFGIYNEVWSCFKENSQQIIAYFTQNYRYGLTSDLLGSFSKTTHSGCLLNSCNSSTHFHISATTGSSFLGNSLD